MSVRIRVVCTGRGTHRELAFEDLEISEGGQIVTIDVEIAGADRHPDDKARLVALRHAGVEFRGDDRHLTWRWRCRRCGRDTQISDARYPEFGARLLALRHAGRLEQLDISALPF